MVTLCYLRFKIRLHVSLQHYLNPVVIPVLNVLIDNCSSATPMYAIMVTPYIVYGIRSMCIFYPSTT